MVWASYFLCVISLTGCSIEDIKKRTVSLPFVMLFFISNIGFLIREQEGLKQIFFQAAGGLSLGIVFLLFSLISKESLGMGDSMIILGGGISLGLFQNLWIVFWSMLFAAAYGLIQGHIRNMKRFTIAFVPFYSLVYLTMRGLYLWQHLNG